MQKNLKSSPLSDKNKSSSNKGNKLFTPVKKTIRKQPNSEQSVKSKWLRDERNKNLDAAKKKAEQKEDSVLNSWLAALQQIHKLPTPIKIGDPLINEDLLHIIPQVTNYDQENFQYQLEGAPALSAVGLCNIYPFTRYTRKEKNGQFSVGDFCSAPRKDKFAVIQNFVKNYTEKYLGAAYTQSKSSSMIKSLDLHGAYGECFIDSCGPHRRERPFNAKINRGALQRLLEGGASRFVIDEFEHVPDYQAVMEFLSAWISAEEQNPVQSKKVKNKKLSTVQELIAKAYKQAMVNNQIGTQVPLEELKEEQNQKTYLGFQFQEQYLHLPPEQSFCWPDIQKDRKVSQILVTIHEQLDLNTAVEKGVKGLGCAATLISGLMKNNQELMKDHFVSVAAGLLANCHLDPVHLLRVPLLYTGSFQNDADFKISNLIGEVFNRQFFSLKYSDLQQLRQDSGEEVPLESVLANAIANFEVKFPQQKQKKRRKYALVIHYCQRSGQKEVFHFHEVTNVFLDTQNFDSNLSSSEMQSSNLLSKTLHIRDNMIQPEFGDPNQILSTYGNHPPLEVDQLKNFNSQKTYQSSKCYKVLEKLQTKKTKKNNRVSSNTFDNFQQRKDKSITDPLECYIAQKIVLKRDTSMNQFHDNFNKSVHKAPLEFEGFDLYVCVQEKKGRYDKAKMYENHFNSMCSSLDIFKHACFSSKKDELHAQVFKELCAKGDEEPFPLDWNKILKTRVGTFSRKLAAQFLACASGGSLVRYKLNVDEAYDPPEKNYAPLLEQNVLFNNDDVVMQEPVKVLDPDLQKIQTLYYDAYNKSSQEKVDICLILSLLSHDLAIQHCVDPVEQMIVSLATSYAIRANFGIQPGQQLLSTCDLAVLVCKLMRKRHILPYEVGFNLSTQQIFDQTSVVYGSWPLVPPLPLPHDMFVRQLKAMNEATMPSDSKFMLNSQQLSAEKVFKEFMKSFHLTLLVFLASRRLDLSYQQAQEQFNNRDIINNFLEWALCPVTFDYDDMKVWKCQIISKCTALEDFFDHHGQLLEELPEEFSKLVKNVGDRLSIVHHMRRELKRILVENGFDSSGPWPSFLSKPSQQQAAELQQNLQQQQKEEQKDAPIQKAAAKPLTDRQREVLNYKHQFSGYVNRWQPAEQVKEWFLALPQQAKDMLQFKGNPKGGTCLTELKISHTFDDMALLFTESPKQERIEVEMNDGSLTSKIRHDDDNQASEL